jgi:hypothetical protein
MRTTLTLDDDVAAELARLPRTQGQRFKVVVNDALRRGLRERRPEQKRAAPLRTRSVSLGGRIFANVDNIADTLSVSETKPSSDIGRRKHPRLCTRRLVPTASDDANVA